MDKATNKKAIIQGVTAALYIIAGNIIFDDQIKFEQECLVFQALLIFVYVSVVGCINCRAEKNTVDKRYARQKNLFLVLWNIDVMIKAAYFYYSCAEGQLRSITMLMSLFGILSGIFHAIISVKLFKKEREQSAVSDMHVSVRPVVIHTIALIAFKAAAFWTKEALIPYDCADAFCVCCFILCIVGSVIAETVLNRRNIVYNKYLFRCISINIAGFSDYLIIVLFFLVL